MDEKQKTAHADAHICMLLIATADQFNIGEAIQIGFNAEGHGTDTYWTSMAMYLAAKIGTHFSILEDGDVQIDPFLDRFEGKPGSHLSVALAKRLVEEKTT